MFKLSSKLLLTLIFISTSTASIISVHDLTLTPYLNRVQLCGSGYTSAEGSSHVDDCVCDLGYYGASCDPMRSWDVQGCEWEWQLPVMSNAQHVSGGVNVSG